MPEQLRLNALVFIKYNLQLELSQKQRKEKEDNYDPPYLSDLELESDDKHIVKSKFETSYFNR